MRRLWFKKRMADAILARKKTRTSRYSELKPGLYQAVRGSRFKAQVFAILDVSIGEPITWFNLLNDGMEYWREEGFEDGNDMYEYISKEKLIRQSTADMLFSHKFSLKEINHSPTQSTKAIPEAPEASELNIFPKQRMNQGLNEDNSSKA